MVERKAEDYLVLLARYSPAFVRQEFIPEIEKNCEQFGIYDATAYDAFQRHQFAADSMYFHHSYAVADIPIGQEYEALAYREDGKIQADSIQKCPSKVLCFFTAFKTQPSSQASRGHHELSLIQFKKGIPPMINVLFEVTERKGLDISKRKEIYLGSERQLRKIAHRQAAAEATAELLENIGIMHEEDYRALEKKKASEINGVIEKMVLEKYELEECDVVDVLQDGLFALYLRNR